MSSERLPGDTELNAAVRAAFEAFGPPVEAGDDILPSPASPWLPAEVAEALANRAVRGAELETTVPRMVSRLRRRLRREAVSCAVDALYHWVGKGVEHFNATCGWIFLFDREREALWSVPGATARTANRHVVIPVSNADRSIVARVFVTGQAHLSNDVARASPVYREIDPRTRSELAVPLYDADGPDEGKVIGVYNLEADREGAFTPAQASEIRRNAALLTLHLLVLREWQAARGKRPWVWHPEMHGWSPGKLLERFCHATAKAVAAKGELRPACSVWNYAPLTGQCWTLGTSGYDYDFLTRYALGPDSLVSRVAAADRRAVARGTPEELGFVCLHKARQAGIKRVAVASLSVPEQAVRGTFNLYALDAQIALPTDRLMVWLAEEVERFLATVNAQRVTFGKAYVAGQLAKSASPTPDFRVLRRALSTILPANALSMYVREGGGDELRCIDSTGFGPGVQMSAVTRRVKDPQLRQDSLTAHCAAHPGTAVCVNFGPTDPIYQVQPMLAQPAMDLPESIVVGDPYHRRRLGVGVPAGPGSQEALGVIRMYRSAKERPFTEADQQLLEAIGASWACCRSLFIDWGFGGRDGVGPNLFSPTTTLLEDCLRKSIRCLEQKHLPVLQGSVFVRRDDARPQYRRLAYSSHHYRLPPEEVLAEPSDDLVGPDGWRYPDKITVLPCLAPDGKPVARVCVPLRAWSGSYLVQAIFALDFPGRSAPLDDEAREQVLRDAVRAAAVLSTNEWQADPRLLTQGSDRLLSAYRRYVTTTAKTNVQRAAFRFLHGDEEPVPLKLPLCPDPELAASGVRVNRDGWQCLVPLWVGPYRVAELLCELSEDLAAGLATVIASHRKRRGLRDAAQTATGNRDGEGDALGALRRTVSLVSGAWARLVAVNVPLWTVRFVGEQTQGDTTIWQEEIALREPPPRGASH